MPQSTLRLISRVPAARSTQNAPSCSPRPVHTFWHAASVKKFKERFGRRAHFLICQHPQFFSLSIFPLTVGAVPSHSMTTPTPTPPPPPPPPPPHFPSNTCRAMVQTARPNPNPLNSARPLGLWGCTAFEVRPGPG